MHISRRRASPDAVVQPQKDKKRFNASYKPSVLANDARVIVACDVHPSSETKVVPELLDQATTHGEVDTALLDAGYFSEGVMEATAARESELLCPEGKGRAKTGTSSRTSTIPRAGLATTPKLTATAVRKAKH